MYTPIHIIFFRWPPAPLELISLKKVVLGLFFSLPAEPPELIIIQTKKKDVSSLGTTGPGINNYLARKKKSFPTKSPDLGSFFSKKHGSMGAEIPK